MIEQPGQIVRSLRLHLIGGGSAHQWMAMVRCRASVYDPVVQLVPVLHRDMAF